MSFANATWISEIERVASDMDMRKLTDAEARAALKRLGFDADEIDEMLADDRKWQ